MNDILQFIKDDNEKNIYLIYSANPYPFDVISFGAALGLDIRESGELPCNISGFIKRENDKIVICVNSDHHEHRKRFTIAHELGHYFLHNEDLNKGIVDNILKREEGDGTQKEKDANDFAANLLMPDKLFRELWLSKDCNIRAIATMFFVSESAVLMRAKSLRLIKEYNSYYV